MNKVGLNRKKDLIFIVNPDASIRDKEHAINLRLRDFVFSLVHSLLAFLERVQPLHRCTNRHKSQDRGRSMSCDAWALFPPLKLQCFS